MLIKVFHFLFFFLNINIIKKKVWYDIMRTQIYRLSLKDNRY
jgi:hypothetical protein